MGSIGGNPQLELQEKGVTDSGYYRHMTGNNSYLSDYEEIDGRFVAFGGDPKGGKITKKGKISTGKLDFEDVYFVKELKFNLFSVSQMCDKKNSVLFTDTECVVLSPDFKLLDEYHVLLRVLRKDNMYSIDLKNIVPSGEADMTNLDTHIFVSPTPTTKIHKDHPLEQIIKDIHSAPQTRRMTKSVTDHVDLPYGKRAIGTKWIYRNNKDEIGIVVRNKARLVAQGYTQEEGIDYDEIEEEVYVYQHPGFEDPEFPDRVYKVEKALYGLHQTLRASYETLSTYLLDNRFQRDDIIFGSTKKSLCTEFEKLMHKKFHMSSMGELTFFLGLQVTQKDDGIFISQDKYVDEILKKFGFSTVKTVSTPMETSKSLMKDENSNCARFQVTPKVSHIHAVKRIFRYLKGQPKLGLWYPKDSLFDLEAYTDSDYAGASLDRKSTTRGCHFWEKIDFMAMQEANYSSTL
ncbi:putative ribonuclease H-like domain-containing protein [Tanacetum coccineum]